MPGGPRQSELDGTCELSSSSEGLSGRAEIVRDHRTILGYWYSEAGFNCHPCKLLGVSVQTRRNLM
jgi:hypothetical protein